MSTIVAKQTPGGDNSDASLGNEDQTKTFREFFKTYNAMSEMCFNLCVWDFGTNILRY